MCYNPHMAVDTLKLYERLKKADLSDAASREIAEVIKEGGEQGRETLATKDDLKAEIARIEKIMATKEDIAKLENKMSQLEVHLIKWVIGIGIAAFGGVVALLKLLKLI